MQYVFLLHILVDWFALGKSTTKIFLTLSALAILFVSEYVIHVRNKKNQTEKVSKGHVWNNSFFIGAGILFLFGLGVTLYYYHILGISGSYLPVAVGGRDNSMTQFFHTHVLKFSFGFIANFLPTSLRLLLENRTDFGFAFNGILPDWIGVVGFAGFLYMFATGLGIFFSYIKRQKGRLWLKVLFVIVLVSTVKNIFDGGFLNSETIPALTVLCVLVYGKDLRRSWQMWLPVALQCLPLIAVCVAYPYGAISLTDIPLYLERLYGLELILLSWLFLAEGRADNVQKKIGAVISIVLGIYFIWPVLTLNSSDISYEYTSLAYQNAYLATYDLGNYGTFVEKIGDLYFYDIATTTNITIGDLAGMAHASLSYYPVSVMTPDCALPHAVSLVKYPVLSREPLTKPAVTHSFENISVIKSFGMQNGWYEYLITVISYPCAPRTLDTLRELVEEAGGTHAVLLDKVEYSDITY